MCKNHNRSIIRVGLQIIGQPCELIWAQIAQPAIHVISHIYQANKMHTIRVEAIPAITFGALAITFKIQFAVVSYVMLAGDIKYLIGFNTF